MKMRRICPKCNGRDIMIVDGNIGPYGTGNNIKLGLLITSAVLVNRYICMDCGYSEEWIDTNDLEAIRRSRKSHQ